MNRKELLRKMGVCGVADLAVRFKAFIVIPIISKMLGSSSYGAWSLLMTAVGMLLPFVMLGLQFALLRYLPGTPKDEAGDDVSSAACVVTFASIVGACVLVAMSDVLSNKFFGGMQFSLSIKITGVYLVTFALRELFLSYFRAREHLYFYSLMLAVDALLSVVALLTLAYLGRGVNALLSALAALNVLMILVLYMKMRLEISFAQLTFARIRPYLSYSLPFLPLIVMLWVVNSSDRYFLAYFRTMREVGIYSACYSISYFVMNAFVAPLYIVFQPKITNAWNSADYAQAGRSFSALVKFAIFLMLPSAACFMVIGKQVITILTTADFATGAVILPFVMLGYFAFLLATCGEIVIYLKDGSKRLLPIYLITALLNILLNIVLIPRIGMLGAAIATACSFVVQCVLTMTIIKRYGILSADAPFIFKSVAASVAMGILISLMPQGGLINVFIVALSGVVVYMCLALLTGMIAIPGRVLTRR